MVFCFLFIRPSGFGLTVQLDFLLISSVTGSLSSFPALSKEVAKAGDKSLFDCLKGSEAFLIIRRTSRKHCGIWTVLNMDRHFCVTSFMTSPVKIYHFEFASCQVTLYFLPPPLLKGHRQQTFGCSETNGPLPAGFHRIIRPFS